MESAHNSLVGRFWQGDEPNMQRETRTLIEEAKGGDEKDAIGISPPNDHQKHH
jgi:hypothetical protein